MITRLTVTAALALAMGAAGAHAQTLRIGTEGAYPPWNYTDASGALVGFEIDLANALCAAMEVECEFIAQDWDGIIPALQNGRYDVIMAGMSITDERREVISFTQGYATTPASIATYTGSDLDGADFASLTDMFEALDGGTIGVQVATIHQNVIETYMPNADLRFYDTQDQLNLDLSTGRIDAGLADITAWLDLGDDGGVVLVGEPFSGADVPELGEGVGIGIRQDDVWLQVALEQTLCRLAESGELAAITETHFGFDASLPCPGE